MEPHIVADRGEKESGAATKDFELPNRYRHSRRLRPSRPNAAGDRATPAQRRGMSPVGI
jgi:hypothetical protein